MPQDRQLQMPEGQWLQCSSLEWTDLQMRQNGGAIGRRSSLYVASVGQLDHANDWWLQPWAVVCRHLFSDVIWHCTTEINSTQLQDSFVMVHHQHHHLYFKTSLPSTLRLGSNICSRVDSHTSGDILQELTRPLVAIIQLFTHGFWREFLVAKCPSLHQPAQIREETL